MMATYTGPHRDRPLPLQCGRLNIKGLLLGLAVSAGLWVVLVLAIVWGLS